MSSNSPLYPGAVTRIQSQPTTLSARAAARLADGPLDATTLMRDVCQVARLSGDAADRMAVALLSSHSEFMRLPSGHWALRDPSGAPILRKPASIEHTLARAVVMERPSPFDQSHEFSPALRDVG